ncbi:MAG: DUF2487 family protein [Bacilli bacterium]|nr:DUF2487 family protein [Bacilli bacterium]
MKWLRKDLEKYVQAKEYVDTVIIPVQMFQVVDENQLEKDSFDSEVLAIFANEIEKELSGRVMLAPAYTYVKGADLGREAERLNEWIKHLKQQPFKHIFVLTLDMQWKKSEASLDANLLWLPGLKPTNLQSQEAVQVIRGQIEQISELIRSYW